MVRKRMAIMISVCTLALLMAGQFHVNAQDGLPSDPLVSSPPVLPAGSLTDLVIVIDPGHGYRGAPSVPSGANRVHDGVTYYEDDMTWNMALGAKEYFVSNYPATQVIFTHDTIVDDDDWDGVGGVTLTDRWWMANNLQNKKVTDKLGYVPRKPKADIFLSFHMNTYTNNTTRGTLCFRSSLGTAATWANKSKQLCDDVLASTGAIFPVKDYTVQTWTTGKYFDSLNMPHAVIEAGFLTNKTDTLWFAKAAIAKQFGAYTSWAAMDFWYNDCGTTCQP